MSYITFTTLSANSAVDKLVIFFFTTLSANSAVDKLVIFFFFFFIFLSKQDLTFFAICLQWRQILFPGIYKKNISKCHLLKNLPRVLRVVQIFIFGYYKKCISITTTLIVTTLFATSVDNKL